MNCPRCNAELSFKKDFCDNCGQDLTDYRHILSLSNSCYNQGLAQAKVRDLSGAILSLKKSLKLNKKNTSARNLLGVIYYEQGEVVSALSEWVISKHFQEDHNAADEYIAHVQENPNKLDTYNTMIKKYNTALASAKNGDDDMAIIQLKKVVNNHPKFIRANQLLALLYMRTGRKENRIRAYRLLKNIGKVDVTNTTTLQYLQELSDIKVKPEAKKATETKAAAPARRVLPKVDADAYKQITPYKEERPSVMPFVHVVIGVVIGIIVMQFLIVPHLTSKTSKEANKEFKTYSEKLADGDTSSASLKNQNTKLQQQVKSLQTQLSKLQGGDPNDLSSIQDTYDNMIAAIQYFQARDNLNAAKALVKVNSERITSKDTLKYYNQIKKATFTQASENFFIQGRDCYNGQGTFSGKQNFDKAIKLLNKSLEYNEDNTDAMYFLGRCYQQKSDTDKAAEYYNKIIDNYPDSSRVTEAKSKLREMGK